MDKNISLAPGVPDGIYEAYVLITKIVVSRGQAHAEVSDNHKYFFEHKDGRLFPCHLYVPDAEKYPNWPYPEPGFREEKLNERRSVYSLNSVLTNDIECFDDAISGEKLE